MIRNREILLGGNLKLKLYGTLQCQSGRRMKKTTRVFFSSAEEALAQGFRPCAHCMNAAYQKWKNGSVQ